LLFPSALRITCVGRVGTSWLELEFDKKNIFNAAAHVIPVIGSSSSPSPMSLAAATTGGTGQSDHDDDDVPRTLIPAPAEAPAEPAPLTPGPLLRAALGLQRQSSDEKIFDILKRKPVASPTDQALARAMAPLASPEQKDDDKDCRRRRRKHSQLTLDEEIRMAEAKYRCFSWGIRNHVPIHDSSQSATIKRSKADMDSDSGSDWFTPAPRKTWRK
jgi:hypothetical protein